MINEKNGGGSEFDKIEALRNRFLRPDDNKQNFKVGNYYPSQHTYNEYRRIFGLMMKANGGKFGTNPVSDGFDEWVISQLDNRINLLHRNPVVDQVILQCLDNGLAALLIDGNLLTGVELCTYMADKQRTPLEYSFKFAKYREEQEIARNFSLSKRLPPRDVKKETVRADTYYKSENDVSVDASNGSTIKPVILNWPRK